MKPTEDEPPVRVLMLVHSLCIGGAETAVCRVAEALVSLECVPVVCTWRWGGALESRLRRAGIAVEIPRAEVSGWRRARVLGRLREIVRRHRIDVIHAHMSDSAFWGVLLGRLTGRACILTHHSNDLVDGVGRNRPFYDWMRRRLLHACARAAAFNIAVAPTVARKLVVEAGVRTDLIEMIPNSVALPPPDEVAAAGERRRRDAAAHFADTGRPRILYAGRLCDGKGLTTLIDALPAVVAKFPKATLVLLGDGPLTDELRSRAHALGLADHVSFPGAVEDVAPWFAAADAYASASLLEGLSNSMLEAMSWGVPVVVSDIDGHHEVVRDGDTGRLVPTESPAAVAAALVETLTDLPAAERRVRKALQLIASEYSVQKSARRRLDLYRRCIVGKFT